jgi:hypothetical protein
LIINITFKHIKFKIFQKLLDFTYELGIDNPYNLTLPSLADIENQLKLNESIPINSNFTQKFDENDSLNFSQDSKNNDSDHEESKLLPLEIKILLSILIPTIVILMIIVCCCCKLKDGSSLFSKILGRKNLIDDKNSGSFFTRVNRNVKKKNFNLSNKQKFKNSCID